MSSTITNLPIEVIDIIFGHLTMANDRRRAAQVCNLFNKVIRSQSIRNRSNTLRLDRSLSGESPFRTFEDWETLPFSNLVISDQTWTQNIVMEPAFWSAHGHEISEMILYHDSNFNMEKSMLSILSSYFPNLKKLKIEEGWTNFDIGSNVQNTLNCSLPIVELSLFSINSHEAILTYLRCSPHLKKLEIETDEPELLPKILPWLESVEASCLHFLDEVPLAKLINLPSKVVFGRLEIKVDEKPEMFQEFFKRPRVIETLILKRRDYNLEFNQYEEEGENNPEFIYFTRDQVEALSGAKSIREVELYGVLDFGGSLDLLAQLPGVESIFLDLTWHRPDQLYPLYWSSPETAKKITKIKHKYDSALDYLDGLSSLTTFIVHRPYGYHLINNIFSCNEIQHLIRNCPNLKEIAVAKILANDADLIGTGDRLPFSSLGKLETLIIFNSPNITPEVFKSAFKFPNLKHYSLRSSPSSGKPFNQNDAKFFTQNCPNVSELDLSGVQINEDAFDYLIPNLPYLQTIHIFTNETHTPMINEKVRAMEKEFPYLKFKHSVRPLSF